MRMLGVMIENYLFSAFSVSLRLCVRHSTDEYRLNSPNFLNSQSNINTRILHFTLLPALFLAGKLNRIIPEAVIVEHRASLFEFHVCAHLSFRNPQSVVKCCKTPF